MAMTTVGELRKALAEVDDNTPLSVSTAGTGFHDCGEWVVEVDPETGVGIYGQ